MAATPPKSAKPVTYNANAAIAAYNQGRTAYVAGNYAAAEPLLKKAVSLAHPQQNATHLGLMYHMLGNTAYRLHHNDDASAYFQKALTYNNTSALLVSRASVRAWEHYMLGLMAVTGNQSDIARQHLENALQLSSAAPENNNFPKAADIQAMLDELQTMGQESDYLNLLPGKVIRWSHPEQPVQVYISEAPTISHWQADYAAIVQDAFAEWEQALQGNVHYQFVQSPDLADMTVNWMDVPRLNTADKTHSEYRHGLCEWRGNEEYMIENNIYIAVNALDHNAFTPTELHNTLLHEIGHSIGLVHGHSNNPNDLMYPSTKYSNGQRMQLSARDINTALKLYALKPEITNPAGINLTQYARHFELYRQASDAYNAHNYQSAYQNFKAANNLYASEPNTHFWMGMSAWNLNLQNEAMPLFLSAASKPGKYRANALQMVSVSLIKTGGEQDNRGAYRDAEANYRQALQYLQLSLQQPGIKPEMSMNLQQQYNWIQHRLALGSQRNIQWGNGTAAKAESSEPKKKHWWSWLAWLFTSDTTYRGPSVPIMVPSFMIGY